MLEKLMRSLEFKLDKNCHKNPYSTDNVKY